MTPLAAGLALAAWFGIAGAQSFPTRPVTLISPPVIKAANIKVE
jgi:hypothetical protein